MCVVSAGQTIPDWSCLPGNIIQTLSCVLKSKYRWRRDSPSLRGLNKHWRDELNLCITRLRPAKQSGFSQEALATVSKFVNLQTLNLTPFLILLARKNSQDMISSLKCLENLRGLRHLEVFRPAAYAFRSCSSDCFSNVTSVRFNDIKFRTGHDFSLLSSSPVQDAHLVLSSGTNCFHVPWVKTLKNLTIWTRNLPSCFIESVTLLTSLKFCTVASSARHKTVSIKNYQLLANMQSLTSLQLPDTFLSSTDWLTRMPNLKCLNLNLFKYETQRFIFWNHVKELSGLISFSFPFDVQRQHLRAFLKAAKGLQSLEISGVPNEEKEYTALFSRLTRLSLHEKNGLTTLHDLLSLPSLQEFSVLTSWWSRSILDPSRPSWSKYLIVLELSFYINDSKLYQISFLRTLKKLCLYCSSYLSNCGIAQLWKLKHLKELCLGKVERQHQLKRNPCLHKVIENLELFGLVSSYPKLTAVQWIKRVAPHVRITRKLDEFQNLSCIGQKTVGRGKHLM